MISPDTKDWTWVLERSCPQCGFDAGSCAAHAVPDLIRENSTAWRGLLDGGAIRPGRPDPSTWSSLEYACHVRDVYVRYDQRIALMLGERDPLFPNWDQDASATDDQYDEQDPSSVVASIGTAGEVLAHRLEGLTDVEWRRSGRRSDGASFTIDTLARYMIHDPIHHIWDVTTA